MALWKTTIEIFTDRDPRGMEIVDLAEEASTGNAYCTRQESVEVEVRDLTEEDPTIAEFFNLDTSED